MKTKRSVTFPLLFAAVAFSLPSYAKDNLLVTTGWADGKEQALLIDPDNGEIRTLWSGACGELDAVVSPDGTQLYLTYVHSGKGDELAVIEIATGVVRQRVETPQLLRWINPSWPGMAISADGRWLHLLAANYAAGPYDFFLITFDTQEGRFLSGELPISDCPLAQILPSADRASALVLCGERSETRGADPGFVLRFNEFAQAEVDRAGQTIYVATQQGRVEAVNLETRRSIQRTESERFRGGRVMRSSGTFSAAGRLWYLPMDSSTGQGIEQILVIDTQTMTLKATIAPDQPFWGLALSSDGERLYVSVPEAHSIAVFDTRTAERLRTLEIVAKPSILLAFKTP